MDVIQDSQMCARRGFFLERNKNREKEKERERKKNECFYFFFSSLSLSLFASMRKKNGFDTEKKITLQTPRKRGKRQNQKNSKKLSHVVPGELCVDEREDAFSLLWRLFSVGERQTSVSPGESRSCRPSVVIGIFGSGDDDAAAAVVVVVAAVVIVIAVVEEKGARRSSLELLDFVRGGVSRATDEARPRGLPRFGMQAQGKVAVSRFLLVDDGGKHERMVFF